MRFFFSMLALASLAVAATGCSFGQAPYDYTYPAYGGGHYPNNTYGGRVGSVYDSPNGQAMGGAPVVYQNAVPVSQPSGTIVQPGAVPMPVNQAPAAPVPSSTSPNVATSTTGSSVR